MKEDHIRQVVRLMHEAFIHAEDEDYLANLRQQIIEMSRQFSVPSL
jgi:glycine/serine hydroxymethyltransferase